MVNTENTNRKFAHRVYNKLVRLDIYYNQLDIE